MVKNKTFMCSRKELPLSAGESVSGQRSFILLKDPFLLHSVITANVAAVISE